MPQFAVPESHRAEVVPATAFADEPRPLLLDPDPAAGHEVGGAELDDAGVVVGTASDGVDDLEATSGRVVGQVERGWPGRRIPRCEQPFSVGVADRREARALPSGRTAPIPVPPAAWYRTGRMMPLLSQTPGTAQAGLRSYDAGSSLAELSTAPPGRRLSRHVNSGAVDTGTPGAGMAFRPAWIATSSTRGRSSSRA